MPFLSKSLPKYRKHRASGQAVVTLGGKDVYLGPHGTKASWREFDRVIAEWLQNGRTVPQPDAGLTVVELFAAYKRFAVKYYRKNGKVTREVGCVVPDTFSFPSFPSSASTTRTVRPHLPMSPGELTYVDLDTFAATC